MSVFRQHNSLEEVRTEFAIGASLTARKCAFVISIFSARSLSFPTQAPLNDDCGGLSGKSKELKLKSY